MRRESTSESGFTLVEIMVVVLIIAVLVGIAVPQFLGARTRAQARAAQLTLATATKAAATAAEPTSLDASAMSSAEPAITFVSSSVVLASAGPVDVVAVADEVWGAATLDGAGVCHGSAVVAGAVYGPVSMGAGSTCRAASGAAAAIAADGRNVVVGGGFEMVPMNAARGVGDVGVSPWTITTGSVDTTDRNWSWRPSSGRWSIDLFGDGIGALSQTLSTVPGTPYRMTMAIAANPGADCNGFPRAVDVLWGGGAVRRIIVSGPGQTATVDGATALAWDVVAMDLPAPPSSSTVLALEGVGIAPYTAGCNGFAVDDVAVLPR
jgi:prepilin-type N-terminal cleavage/methylation domain-containing protein